MKLTGSVMETEGVLEVARQICIAARTAPKGKGTDNLFTLVLTDSDKNLLAAEMQKIGEEENVPFFIRDAECMRKSQAVVLLGTKIETLGVKPCGFCGFKDCESNRKANGICAFNTGDLGIALGSAVSVATDHRVDTRIFFSAGLAALNLNLLGEEVKIAYGIPLSVSGKSPFFDRKA